MRLKRVRIFGFKTFADRTEFELDGGVVAVVGPNGCGKSNLVDAILWGLGEGNARQLRAQTTQDVIFSGSANRKPVGFAEVSLLFDNEDGALPVDTSEVTISRRLTRAGESEYAINRQTCRLRDVYELLADSGLGRSGYAIVGQKEIDSALAASAEDRRAWIDEAAGVQRYRAKKVESLRRLTAAEDHLTRVTDIVRELDQQLEPLREEAEVAKKYKVAASALREVEVGLLVRDFAESSQAVLSSIERVEASNTLLTKTAFESERLETESDTVARKARELEIEIERLRTKHREASASVERAQADIRLGNQRLASFDELESTLQEDTQTTQERLKDAELELELATLERDRNARQLAELKASLVGSDEEAAVLARTLQTIDSQLTEARSALTRQMKADAELAHRRDRLRAANRELAGIDRTMPDLLAGIAEAEAAFRTAMAPLEAAELRLEEMDRRLRALRKEDDDDARAVRDSLAERSSLEGRRRGIEATIDSHEGLAQGSRAVLAAVEAGALTGEYTAVAQAIRTDRDLALAIETALGNSANDLICNSDIEAKSAIAWLKGNEAGRATFQPISLMRPAYVTDELRRLTKDVGVVGVASELVECESRFRPVIDSLLSRICIVETLDDGLKLARTSGWSRLVSLDGEVVHQAGAVSGGRNSRSGYGFVQRRADLDEIEQQLAALEKVVSEHDRRVRKRTRESEEILSDQATLRDSLLEMRDDAHDSESLVTTLLAEKRDAERSRAKLATEIESLSKPAEGAAEIPDVATLEAHRDAAVKELAARTVDAESAESRLREAELRNKEAEARHDIAERRVQNYRLGDDQRTRRLSNLEPERARVRIEIGQLESDLGQFEKKREEFGTLLDAAHLSRESHISRNGELTELLKSLRRDSAAVGDTLRQAEITRARSETKKAAAAERLLEQYSISEQEATAQVGLIEVPDDAQSVVSRLRREIKAMGEVNIGAIEAFDRVSVRYTELEAQRDDVQQGIDTVRASIKELDDMTREKFTTTFFAVAEAFGGLFQKLFGGGEGALSLTDPNDILESGVDINVTLPGKRRQGLNLLSGGERSLCATAFLFSLLQVRPAPLVVLDEVDAPLDGRNVERFAALLQEFVDRIQFIVITHNPATIESAPIWLGVTMQEPGVSTLVPARLPGEKARVHVTVESTA